MRSFDAKVAAAIDATRPRVSGPSVNVHVVRSPTMLRPDFERMRAQIEGTKKESAKEFEQEQN